MKPNLIPECLYDNCLVFCPDDIQVVQFQWEVDVFLAPTAPISPVNTRSLEKF